jgi:hypothetical protein
MEVVEWLARRAGMTLERGTDFRQTAGWAERQLVQRLQDALLNTPPALSYATQMRGWTMQTIRLARLGFMPSDKRPLLDKLTLSDTWRGILHKFPAGMLVYVHLEKGRLNYLSGRSIEGKKHYNPPRDIIGERQPYYASRITITCTHQPPNRLSLSKDRRMPSRLASGGSRRWRWAECRRQMSC